MAKLAASSSSRRLQLSVAPRSLVPSTRPTILLRRTANADARPFRRTSKLARGGSDDRLAASSAETVTTTDTAAPTISTTTVYVRGSDLQRSLMLEVLPEGKGQAVVVVGVLEGSEADRLGIVPGQKIIAIGDPIRPDQMWPLGATPSLRFVKDTITMMRSKELALELTAQPVFTSAAGAISDAESVDEDSLTLVSNVKTANDGGAPEGMTIGERLAQRYDNAQSMKQTKSDVQKRIEKRKAYMEEVSQRSDSSFIGWVAGLFLGPALVILAIAYGTGYLDSMYVNSLSSFR